MTSPKKIKITLIKSTISRIPKHRATVAALGLRRIGDTTCHLATPDILGMIKKVSYLLKCEDYNVRTF
jgi:large subunit ribosomal protein L30